MGRCSPRVRGKSSVASETCPDSDSRACRLSRTHSHARGVRLSRSEPWRGSQRGAHAPRLQGGIDRRRFHLSLPRPASGRDGQLPRAREDRGANTADAKGADFVAKRVIGVPGDTIAGRDGRVLVNGRKADDIPTPPFAAVRLGRDEYFVMGDNRSYSQDSRDFGPVPREAIFSRVILVWWPLGRFGPVGYDKTLTPPGQVSCD
jgi:signal peptidase S26 family